ncbi:methyl-accepting chemotaxis protein [Pseudomonas psychrotolerans L19]|uniref:methyl-accepting chemotaxis protein n=3 Tax=Pseudomonas TaxID=286 RepID=UPI00023A3E07|nr:MULTISPECIES: methyl-accepting chemotaxis protein [Pseudomonas]EHK70705.1 methyl-accepting chemotaxis protein [Pseudomonas psychrotolerans L19]MBA1182195.1 methyl-accepting chemotaxis protein [Pseudomonas psychrotolerans]MBA1212624.1 methyl-accepting chemotaxis protein [Pseudomonas psychrotolerans]TCQ84716.1 methyl-accepting chemotaxis protein [Pseudomonas sp. JUb52]
MVWFNNLALAKKLAVAFGLCTAITLGIGAVGMSGLNSLNALLNNLLSDNLRSIVLLNDAKSNVIGHNRDLFRLLSMAYGEAPQNDQEAVIASMKSNQADAEKPFAAYRATPLEDDEKQAGDAFERDWKTYIAGVDSILARLAAKDVAGAAKLLNEQVQPTYRKTMASFKIMVESNKRQSTEAGVEAKTTYDKAFWTLAGGLLLATLCALALGIIITRMIVTPIRQAVTSAERVAQGDLTQAIQSSRRDEAGQLLQALGGMQRSLKDTVQQMAGASSQLAAAAEELHAVTEETSRGQVRQHDELQQAATAVNQMTAAVEEVARNAASTSTASQDTSREAQKGREQVQQAAQAMAVMTGEITDSTQKVQTLEGQVREIGKLLEVIRGIAEQTNLLALNAAIEAARAGEQGRGFAVVADEVRALAHRTQGSTGEIERMMSAVRSSAEEAVSAMHKSQSLADSTQVRANQAGEALDRIAAGVAQIEERNLVIASAAEEQAQVAREVDRNLVNIQDLSTQTATGAQQTAASSQELSRLATSFQGLVAQFRY